MYKVLEKYRGLLIIFLIMDLVSLFPLFKTIDYSLTIPGGINRVDDLIEICNKGEIKGSFNTTYVISLNKLTMYQYLVGMHSSQFLVEKNSPYYGGYTDEDHAISGKVSHQAAIEYALINAFKAAAKKDSTIFLSYQTEGLILVNKPGSYTKLQMGDLIYSVDGHQKFDLIEYVNEIITKDELSKVLSIKKKAYKNGEVKELEMTAKEMLSLGYYRKHTIDLNKSTPKITVNSSNVGGPSGGLLNTLNVYNHLISEDLTKGYKIAGTGTISITGNVGAIGGMEQKIYTAQKNKVDYFLVPYSDDVNSVEYENYTESKNAYKKIKKPVFKIIPVRNFEEAIAELEKLV